MVLDMVRGSFVKDHLHSSFINRRLSGREKREIQREILSLMGLSGRPRPHVTGKPTSAPLFMLDLYHAMSTEDEDDLGQGISWPVLPTLSTQSPPLGTVISEADTVMSFVNMVEQDRDIFHQKPYWKEFKFELQQIPKGEAATAAEFRIYKKKSLGSRGNTTLHISVYEMVKEHSRRGADTFLLDRQDILAREEGWLAFDVTPASNRWLLYLKYNFVLRLYVETDEGNSVDPGLAGLVGQRGPRYTQPFVVTFFRASQAQVRTTRAVRQPRKKVKKPNDLPHSNKIVGIYGHVHANDGRQVCKRHELYISFQELGWMDWVIAPRGYSAYYCEGECSFPLDSCMNATNHAVVQSLVHLMKPEAVPKPCCAPTKLNPITVLYYDNNNVILKKKRNMIVKSCGCH
nr:PREDICTED: bone morphogenetic protein 8B [Latimeria chalumnae]|eukprot:XP_005995651.1 PREDICTED: bone morphogenetic protein 8B [Latimeria chalumnae]